MTSLLLLYGTFMVISLSGALSPGPLTAMAISEGARAGRWSGVRLAVGHGLIELPLVFGIAYGLGVWLRGPVVSGVVAVVGAAVLLWMGYGLVAGVLRGQMHLAGPSGTNTPDAPGAMRWGHIPGGVALTIFNPYWIVWWATVGAAYVSRATNLTAALPAIGGLALTHWLTDLGWLGGLSLLVGSGSGLIGDRGYRAVLLVCGGFLLFCGVSLAWGGVGFLLGR
jgi:threonine/homoserine/homoserine lactone efflux protein